MGKIQSAINDILGEAASITQATVKGVEQGQKVEAKKAEAAIQEQKDIATATEKLDAASLMAVGYSQKQAKSIMNQRALGLEEYNKKPRGVGQKTFERRMANLEAMKEIRNKYAQNQAYRNRILKASPSEIATTLKPTIDKKEVKKNGK